MVQVKGVVRSGGTLICVGRVVGVIAECLDGLAAVG